jgi:hypothetical protein
LFTGLVVEGVAEGASPNANGSCAFDGMAEHECVVGGVHHIDVVNRVEH